MNRIKLLEQRSYATYRARLEAAKRLTRRHHVWNALLVSFATSTTIASIAMLVDTNVYGKHGDLLIVCLGVLSLVASMTVTTLNYSGRAKDMFANYRKMQRLSVRLESIKMSGVVPDDDTVATLSENYQDLLDESENHTAADYVRAHLKPAANSGAGMPIQTEAETTQHARPGGPQVRSARLGRSPEKAFNVLAQWARACFSLTAVIVVVVVALPAVLLIPIARMIIGV